MVVNDYNGLQALIANNNNNVQALIHDEDFNPDNCQFDLASHFNGKPKKALWTSAYLNLEEISDWYLWCRAEEFELRGCLYLIEPKENIKLLELNSIEDLVELPTVRLFNQVILDFNLIAKRGYSGIHLTGGLLFDIRRNMIRRPSILVDSVAESLYSWDCESTVWFNTDWINKLGLVGVFD